MEDIKETLQDPIKFKIYSANYYLFQIPSFVPLDDMPDQRILAERLMESFLYFALSAVDILYVEINHKLSLNIRKKEVGINTIKENLSKSNLDKSKKILNLLENCWTKPQHVETSITEQYSNKQFGTLDTLEFLSKYENRNGKRFYHEWNRKKSWLWELRLLRNQITHTSLLGRMALIGDVRQDFLCVRLNYGTKLHYEMIFVANPKDYFSKSLEKIKILIMEIREILL